jgi:hypothetical protein
MKYQNDCPSRHRVPFGVQNDGALGPVQGQIRVIDDLGGSKVGNDPFPAFPHALSWENVNREEDQTGLSKGMERDVTPAQKGFRVNDLHMTRSHPFPAFRGWVGSKSQAPFPTRSRPYRGNGWERLVSGQGTGQSPVPVPDHEASPTKITIGGS